jgi:hypothetical protein
MAEALFLRLLETQDKGAGLREVARKPDTRTFSVDTEAFRTVPGSPMAYWVRETVLQVFRNRPRFTAGRERFAIRGAYTTDDFRFYRLGWEAPIQKPIVQRRFRRYPPLVKGGSFGRFYYDPHLAICWHGYGAIPKAYLSAYRKAKGWGEDWSACLNGYGEYFRPGLTWPRRTQGGLSLRVMPAGCIFGDKGPAAFVADDETDSLLALLAVTNSAAFRSLVSLQMCFGSYEVGVIQRTPLPDLSPEDEAVLASLAHRAWALKRGLDTITETSHAFSLPALLRGEGSLRDRDAAWAAEVRAAEASLAAIQAEIDDRCFRLYGIDDADRAAIERGFGAPESTGEDADGDDEPEDDSAAPGDTVAALVSWAVGAAFGRFDLRLATGERPTPPAPDPFAALPACSPAMLTGDDGLPLSAPPPGYPLEFPADGILVDDPGAARDILTRIRHVFDVVYGEHGDDRLREATALLDPKAEDLRRWLRSAFFAEHIQRYSKSRRKAPIYWRLGTPSGSFSIWLYIHRCGPDTLHAALRDHAEPKLRHEVARLAALHAELGDTPTPSQRKVIDAQEALVDELSGFRDDLARVAPLWNPDLDDGVVINASFLHRLFAHTRAWQKEVDGHWKALQAGEYDWAHLAMRLWPERVVPKCASDRSLAIAHGLEDTFWAEDEDGRWQPKDVSPDAVAALIASRTSNAVKDALARLGATPEPARTRAARAAAPRTTAAKAAAPREPTQLGLGLVPSQADPAALAAVREALRRFPDGAGKAELLASTGFDEATWKPLIDALVATGAVVRTGQARGTRYHLPENA